MIPKNRIPTHPGVILSQEFLIPLGVSQVTFAKHLGVSTQRINELINGQRGVTPKTAWLLAEALNTTPEFWINLQTFHDLALNRPTEEIPPLLVVADPMDDIGVKLDEADRAAELSKRRLSHDEIFSSLRTQPT